MLVRSPEDMHRTFAERFNAGDIDGLMALYEPDAVLEPAPGTLVTGASIRQALEGFLALKGTIDVVSRRTIKTADLAITHGTWSLAGTAPDGAPVTLGGNTTEVLRRQPDGSWLYVIDLPDDAGAWS
jgi:ketosteroid isomerase-like protein